MDLNFGYVAQDGALEFGYSGAYTGGGVTLDLTLTDHGEAHPNSIMADANFATTGTVLLGVVTDTDQSKVQIDWQAISDGQLWREDISTLDAVTVTATEDTTASFTLAWEVVDTGEAGQFTGTLDISESGDPVVVDETKPVIELYGGAVMYVTRGEPFADPGAKAEDDVDGDLSDQIDVSGTVDTDTAGEYTLTYSGPVDAAGNVSDPVTRTVIVIEAITNTQSTSSFRFSF